MSFDPMEMHYMFMDAFADVEARRRWEKEYKEEHGIVDEFEPTMYDRMLKAGLFDYDKKGKNK